MDEPPSTSWCCSTVRFANGSKEYACGTMSPMCGTYDRVVWRTRCQVLNGSHQLFLQPETCQDTTAAQSYNRLTRRCYCPASLQRRNPVAVVNICTDIFVGRHGYQIEVIGRLMNESQIALSHSCRVLRSLPHAIPSRCQQKHDNHSGRD